MMLKTKVYIWSYAGRLYIRPRTVRAATRPFLFFIPIRDSSREAYVDAYTEACARVRSDNRLELDE